jgi:hypothetical protein
VFALLAGSPALAAENLKPRARALLEHAGSRHDAGDYAAALDAYVQAVTVDPAAADLATIRRLSPILTFKPAEPLTAEQRAEETRIEKGRQAQLKALRQYLQLRPANWEATQELVLWVDLAEAEAALAPIFKSRPADAEVYAKRALVRAKHDRLAAALDDYVKASELDPANAERHYAVGVLAYELARKAAGSATNKRDLIRRGITALTRAEELRADYVASIAYRSLLLREQATLETDSARSAKLLADADALRERALQILRKPHEKPRTAPDP